MFTGLIDDLGTITEVAQTVAGREFRIECHYADLVAGESIAINGACLTVRDFGPHWFTVAAITTTLERTVTGGWREGQHVNLERAMRVGDRLGGHFVQGHVDGVAVVEAVRQHGDARLVDLVLPPGLAELMVEHGSVTVDGVSLTVNALAPRGRPDMIQISLIDYTLRHTTFSDVKVGDRVHIEADMLGKYVQRLLRESTWSSER